jgi:hypothetical protein
VLADTAQLHAKVAEMGQRIRQLEDALAIFQAGVSNEPHPLLRDDLLAIKFGPEKGQVPEKDINAPQRAAESIDAVGTMTIGDHGNEGKYFGPSAGSEVSSCSLLTICTNRFIGFILSKLLSSFVPFSSIHSKFRLERNMTRQRRKNRRTLNLISLRKYLNFHLPSPLELRQIQTRHSTFFTRISRSNHELGLYARHILNRQHGHLRP